MSEDVLTADEQSHYEISLTAGQAFVAFVLLLLSLAASFAFGLMIGRGQADERLVVKKEPAVITEASAIPKKSAGKIVELGVADQDFTTTTPATTTTGSATATETTSSASASAPVVSEAAAPPSTEMPAATPLVTPVETKPAAQPKPVEAKPVEVRSGPAYAQLLSTSDQKTAEALAAKLINGGFLNAYVERGTTEKGTVFRVRVKFPSESEARASEAKLKAFAPEVWITR